MTPPRFASSQESPVTYTAEAIAPMKRQELQSATAQLLGKEASKWLLSATNVELREALLTREAPARFRNADASTDLASAIANAIRPMVAAQLDEEQVRAIALDAIETRLASYAPSFTTIEVKRPDATTINVGRQHANFGQLVTYMGLRLNCYLRGGAGSGKTTACEKAAEALGLPFYCQSMGPQTSQSQLLGYMDATGRFVEGFLFKGFTEGGVICLDEIDNANASVLTVLNSAMANGYCSFPCGMAQKHPDCIFVVSGNTFGTGADALYVGRQQLDAATLNRFVIIEWPYDEAFERDLVQAKAGTSEPVERWVTHVQRLRAAAVATRVRVVFSPRQSMAGATLLAAGRPWSEVEQAVLWAPVSHDDRRKLEANLAN